MDVVALAGGVGAARFLRGLVAVVAADRLTVVANTGDDIRLHGLHVSPDLDTVTYTLGGGVHAEQGWGRAGETFHVAAELRMRPDTLRAIVTGRTAKGDVLAVARVAGIQAAKRTPELIPLCHPLRLTGIDLTFALDERRREVRIEARVRTVDKTGVEMEALTAASVAALTVYDMVKALEKGVTIAEVKLMKKSGGKSGSWTRAGT